MTKEQFETAEMLKQQIRHLDGLIDRLGSRKYEQDPPTRDTCIRIGCDLRICAWSNDLNEAEVVTIIEALKSRKSLLEFEFGRL